MGTPKVLRNAYRPLPAEVVLVMRETPDIATFRFELAETGGMAFAPGQFAMLSILGVGECPISISSSPTDGPWVELTIRKIGHVTAALHRGPPRGALGLRGPFGKPFDFAALRGRPVVCIAGGIGLAPLRSLIHYVNASRDGFGPMTVLYGTQTPQDRLYKEELDVWNSVPRNKVLQIVEADPEKRWRGPVGQVTSLLDSLWGKFDNASAVLCGGDLMVGPVVQALERHGFRAGSVQVALGRRMSCGIGKCGHCYIGGKRVCVDGPVFTAEELRRLGEPL
jgi:NAD(P)H-flavin reductase